MKKTRIALAQATSKTGDLDGNIAKGIQFIEEAAKENADIISFPELFACGYDLEYLSVHKDEMKLSKESPQVQKMAQAAATYKMYVNMPCVLEEDGHYYNGTYLFGRTGEILGTFKKVHLWDEEAKIFEKGSEYPVFHLDFGALGLLICYDAGFPEAARMLALQGAELLLVSGAFCGLHWKRWNQYYPARALENTMYVGAVNATGGHGVETWFGNNRFYGIDGELIREGLINIEEMQIVEADLSKVKEARDAGCYLTDLRNETYHY